MDNFLDLNLPNSVSQAINEMGFKAPTPIQAQTIPTLLAGRTDFLGMAATGTGKTAAYGIPLLSTIDAEEPVTEAIVLCPTRELAKQITDGLRAMGKYSDAFIIPIYGGAGYDEQIRGLKRGAHIVVATPGRLIDHLERGTINLSNVHTVILDEADEMISMGFADDLESVFKAVRKKGSSDKSLQTWLFSATMQPELRRIADRYLDDPAVVQINQSQMLSGTVEQIYYTVREEDKAEVLCRVLDTTENFHGLIFCQTKSLVDEIDRFLRSRGYASDQLHGDRTQSERERTLQRLKRKQIQVLVCTDVAARGLDIKDLSHVINFSIPNELDSYVHRIGRTGRSGEAGIAISLVTQKNFSAIRRIEKLTKSTLTKGTIPTAQDVAHSKVRRSMKNFMGQEVSEELLKMVEDGWGDEFSHFTPAQIAARFLSLLHPELASMQEKELGLEISEQGDERARKNRSGFFGRSKSRGGFSDRGGSRERFGGEKGGRRGSSGRGRSSRGGRFEGSKSGGRGERNGGKSQRRSSGGR